jgi:hypothetical protein
LQKSKYRVIYAPIGVQGTAEVIKDLQLIVMVTSPREKNTKQEHKKS